MFREVKEISLDIIKSEFESTLKKYIKEPARLEHYLNRPIIACKRDSFLDPQPEHYAYTLRCIAVDEFGFDDISKAVDIANQAEKYNKEQGAFAHRDLFEIRRKYSSVKTSRL